MAASSKVFYANLDESLDLKLTYVTPNVTFATIQLVHRTLTFFWLVPCWADSCEYVGLLVIILFTKADT